jgi:glycosyltransferase involved in cell wall biosynthesis
LPANDAAAWAQCLTELFERPEAARELGVRGRETVLARFSIPHVADEHLNLFRSLVSKPGANES